MSEAKTSIHDSRFTIHGQAKPWHHEPWPWILMSGPAAVIVAGAFTTWLAVSSSDGVVADDYYKRGLAINQEIRRDQAAVARGITATVEVRDGMLRVRLSWGQSHFPEGQALTSSGTAGKVTLGKVTLTPLPEALFAQVVHPTRAGLDQRLRLARVAPGVYETELPERPAGRWRLVLEDPRREWRIVKEGI